MDLAAAIDQALAPTNSPWGSSRYGEWRRCGVAHDLRYRLQIVPRPRPIDDMGDWEIDRSDYFALGSLCHSVLRFVQEGPTGLRLHQHDPEQWGRVVSSWQARAQQSAPDAWEIAGDATVLMGAYWNHYGYDNAGWPEGAEILGVEVPLHVRSGILGALPYTATADTLLRMPGGELLIADHKTRGRTLPKDLDRYASGLRTRPQFAGLSWLVQQGYGDETGQPRLLRQESPPAIWVNYIIKPTKTVGPRFERVYVRMDQPLVDRWEDMQRCTADRLALEAQAPVPDWSQCAPEIGSRCQYFEYCHGSAESRDKHYHQKEIKT